MCPSYSYLEAALQVSWPVINDLGDHDVPILVLLEIEAKSPTLVANVQPNLGKMCITTNNPVLCGYMVPMQHIDNQRTVTCIWPGLSFTDFLCEGE